jgi:hypothetical protein
VLVILAIVVISSLKPKSSPQVTNQPVATVEQPQYAIRYLEDIGSLVYVLREIDPPTFQSPQDIYTCKTKHSTYNGVNASPSPDGELILIDEAGWDYFVVGINGGDIQVLGEGENPTWAA